MTLPSRDDALTWIGLPVQDSAGAACGTCRDVFADQNSGLPEWVAVQLGSGDAVFAPTLGASADSGVVRLAHARDVVERSPRFTPNVDRTPAEEKLLYEHYGVAWSDARSDTLLPAAVDGDHATAEPPNRPQRLRRPDAAPAPQQAPGTPPVTPPTPPVLGPPPARGGGGPQQAALVAAPVAVVAVAAAALLRRRRRHGREQEQQERAGLGAAVLVAPLALLATVLGWRRRRTGDVDVLEVGEVGEVQQMPAAADRRTRQEQAAAPW